MTAIKEINLFTNGDSTDFDVFSNVPYFFAKTCIARGIKVNRIDISASKTEEFLYKLFVWPFLKLLNRSTTYYVYRSAIYDKKMREKVEKALEAFPDADLNLFMTFSFSPIGLSKQPIALFGDWTYEHLLTHFLKRSPDTFEAKALARENRYIEKSDFVFVLFPSVFESMKTNYLNKNIHYLGNVINAMESPVNVDLSKKKNNQRLLFIGRIAYKQGADQLIEAFIELKQLYPDLKLDIIGLDPEDFKDLPDDVNCHGYLDKGHEADLLLFYELLREASLFINTNPQRTAFSATLEAMYFYTPVVVTRYEEFEETFGKNLNFGAYFDYDKSLKLSDEIRLILDNPNYEELATNAHNQVKDFTWDNYVTKFLNIVESRDSESTNYN